MSPSGAYWHKAGQEVVAGQVAVTNAALALPTVTVHHVTVRALVTNTMDNPIFLGPAGVTIDTGFPLYPGDTITELDVINLDALHAVVASGSETLVYLGVL